MSRVPIPVTVMSRSGVTPPTATDSDATRLHTLVNNGQTWLEVTSTDGGTQTLSFPLAIESVSRTLSVPAGATRKWGPVPTSYYNQAAIAADQTLTSTGTAPSAGDTVTVAGQTYTFKTTLTEVKASTTLTSTGTAPADSDTVSINDRTYTFKTTLTGAANEVLIGANAAAALTNLKAAVNGDSGEGSTYGTGTVAHATVDAGTLTSTTLVFTAKSVGTAGNSYPSTESSSQLSFPGALFTGGVAAVVNEVLIGGSAANALSNLKAAINDTGTEGTSYSTGTTANTYVTGDALTSTTLLVVAVTAGDAGNDFATTESSSQLSWGAATLEGGYDAGQVCYVNPSVSTNLKLTAYSLV